jgi:hypothetical protein
MVSSPEPVECLAMCSLQSEVCNLKPAIPG